MDSKFIEAALRHDKLFEEENVECRDQKKFQMQYIVDENVDISLVRKYNTSQKMRGRLWGMQLNVS